MPWHVEEEAILIIISMHSSSGPLPALLHVGQQSMIEAIVAAVVVARKRDLLLLLVLMKHGGVQLLVVNHNH